jgi:hypothetical protein
MFAVTFKQLQSAPPWDWPDNAGDIFRGILMDAKAPVSERVKAAQLAGNIISMNNDVAEALLLALSDPEAPEELRGQCAISLGPTLEQMDEPEPEDTYDDPPVTWEMHARIQSELERLYRDPAVPKLVRRRIVEAAVRNRAEWTREAIRTAYGSGDHDWMLTAVFAMAYVRGFEKEILESLNNPDPDIHYQAVAAAGAWELPGAFAHALALVNDPRTPKLLMLAAIDAVAAIRPSDARENIGHLAFSRDQEIRDAANDALAMADGGEWDGEEEDDEDEEESGGAWVN